MHAAPSVCKSGRSESDHKHDRMIYYDSLKRRKSRDQQQQQGEGRRHSGGGDIQKPGDWERCEVTITEMQT